MTILQVAGLALFAAVAYSLWANRHPSNEDLNHVMALRYDEARSVLSADDLARLDHQLRELAAAGPEASRLGMSAKTATRVSKQAAIRTIAGFVEVERRYPTRSAA
jgi:hypothetical protein